MQLPSLSVRPATTQDQGAVWALVQQFAQTATPDSGAFGASFMELADESSRHVLLIAQIGDETVGYSLAHRHQTLFANGAICWVEELMVADHSRRRGVGTALLHTVEEWARDCVYVALATRRAAPFYEALGYVRSAEYFRKMLR